MRRELGSFEKAQAITGENAPYNVVPVVRLSPGPEPTAVRRSLDRLVRRQPLLGARIVREGRSTYFFETGSEVPRVPFSIVDRAGDDSWRAVAEHELQERIQSEEGPLMRCVLLADGAPGAPGELVLPIHHAVIDGAAGLAAVRDLIEGCHPHGSPTGGEETGRTKLPPCADSRFPPGLRRGFGRSRRLAAFLGRQMTDELSYRLRTRGHRRPPIRLDGHCRVLPVTLSEPDTEALIRRSRDQRVTLNSIVNAVLLQVVHRQLYDARPLPLRYMVFPDLRHFLDPPVPTGGLGSYLSTLRLTVAMNPREELWSLARRIQTQVYRAARRGEKFLSSIVAPAMMSLAFRGVAGRMSTVAVSYTGPTNLPRRVGGFEIQSLHAFVSNFGIGPEYTAQARLYRGRLFWDFVYLDSDMDTAGAEVIAQDILHRLREAGE